jgi:hypothetical protein
MGGETSRGNDIDIFFGNLVGKSGFWVYGDGSRFS